VERYTAQEARRIGRSERTVQKMIHRHKILGQETLEKIAGTSLASGIELDALIKRTEQERVDLIERAARGQKVSAVTDKPARAAGR
jgi:hypothetical protein